MANQGLSSRETLLLSLCIFLGAVVIGGLLFLSDIEAFIRETGR